MANTEITAIEAKKDLFKLFCGRAPKKSLLKPVEQLSDAEFTELQDWVGGHQKMCVWTTNIGLIEAIDALVDDAIGNANIVA